MKIFNLKALGNKIRAIITNKYDLLLNRIAIKSKAYKQLYNEYNSFIITNKYLISIDRTINNTKIGKLVKLIFRDVPGMMGNLNSFDTQIIRLTEPNDILIVSDDLEKHRILEEMKYFSGSAQVFTVEDLQNPKTQIITPLGKVYIFSSIWLKDLITIENLVYIIENEKENTRL